MADDSNPKSYKSRRFNDTNRELTELNFQNLQNLWAILEKHCEIVRNSRSYSKNDEFLLCELILVSNIIFNMHFVEKIYVPLFSRNIIKQIVDVKRKKDDSYAEKYNSFSWERKLYEHLSACEFEKANDLFDYPSENYDRNRELYDHIYSIISPVKNYFKEGLGQFYQVHEVIHLFDTMRQNAGNLYLICKERKQTADKDIVK